MTIGPAPMIRMLSMSVRLGIRRHQRDEPLEQIMAILRAWARLGMVLHRKHRLADNPQSFIAVVEERKMGRLDAARQTIGLNDKAMILAGDLDCAGQQILDRMIGSAMAARHFAGAPAERQRHQLVAEANPEYRLARIDQVAQYRHRIDAGRGGVAQPVRQENPVGPKVQDVRGRGGGGDYGNPTTVLGKHSQDVALGSVIDRDNVMPRIMLPAVAVYRLPARLIPLVGLTASDFTGQIHAFET